MPSLLPSNRDSSIRSARPVSHLGSTGVRAGLLALGLAGLFAACSGETDDGGTGGAGGADGLGGNGSAAGGAAGGSGVGGTPTTGGATGEETGGAAGQGGMPTDEPGNLMLRDVAYEGGRFVAVGSTYGFLYRQGVILTSEDGHHWQEVFRGDDLQFERVAAGPEGWVVLDAPQSDTPSTNVVTSADGISWQVVTPPFIGGGVTWTGSKFLAFGLSVPPPDPYESEENPLRPSLWESATGVSWEKFGDPGNRKLPSFVHTHLVVAPPGIVAGGGRSIGVSTDEGASWTWTAFRDLTGEQRVLGDLLTVYWDGQRFVGNTTYDYSYGEVPGARRYSRVYSDDGVDWTWEEADDAFRSVTFRGNLGVAAGYGLSIFYTSEGGAWERSPAQLQAWLVTNGEGLDGERFVAVGEHIWSSEDGVEWTEADMSEIDRRVYAPQ